MLGLGHNTSPVGPAMVTRIEQTFVLNLDVITGGSPEKKATNMPFDLDRFDHAILAVLSAEGRLSATELARRIGLSKSPTQARMKRLEEGGVITGYCARLNRMRIGQAHVAFVEVRLSDTREAALQAFNRAIHTVPEIEECHMIASRFDYLLKVRTGDIQDYRRVLAERISALPHVASTSTYVAMEAVKEAG